MVVALAIVGSDTGNVDILCGSFFFQGNPCKKEVFELFSGTGGELLPPVNVFTDEIHIFK